MKRVRRLTSHEAWGTAGIDDYVNDVAIVWAPHDKRRSMLDFWLRVVQHASSLGELVRRGKYNEAKEQLGRLAIWMLSFVAKAQTTEKGFDGLFTIDKPLSDLLWSKYPNCCAACYTRRVTLSPDPEKFDGSPRECNCILVLVETEERHQTRTVEQKQGSKRSRREYADRNSSHEAHYCGLTLLDLERRFESIFRRNIFALDLEDVAFHFLEEVGEVVEAITQLYTYSKTPSNTAAEDLHDRWLDARLELEEELADAFSWLFAISSKFRDLFATFDLYTGNTAYAAEMTIAAHLQRRHMNQANGRMICFDCEATVCICEIKLVTSDKEAVQVVTGPKRQTGLGENVKS
jgi:NTP pyrophosphatase (non-canonical NTP hydrolase)